MAFIEEQTDYYWAFGILAGLCIALLIKQRKTAPSSQLNSEKTHQFKHFQYNYLLVYLIMIAADWLQGAYVYALYSNYGFSKSEIGLLFVCGFGSSMIFGTVVGSFADGFGRKNNCMLYGILYGISCLTKHFNNFYVLLFGRFLAGMATSILYSAFESWLVFQHSKYNFPNEWLSETFSLTSFANGLVAIASGVVANWVKDTWGFVAPFDVSFFLLMIGTLIVLMTWEENYGNATLAISQTLTNAWRQMLSDKKIILLGLIQSLFEGAMFTFVFMWTPVLEQVSSGELPHGWIFALFMLSIMIGSCIFKELTARFSAEAFMRVVFLLSCATFFLPMLTRNTDVLLFGFLLFEVTVGIFWAAVGVMRSKYIPEENRATIMNFFRIPLNAIVVLILINVGELSISTVFSFCAFFLGVTTLCQQALWSSLKPRGDFSLL